MRIQLNGHSGNCQEGKYSEPPPKTSAARPRGTQAENSSLLVLVVNKLLLPTPLVSLVTVNFFIIPIPDACIVATDAPNRLLVRNQQLDFGSPEVHELALRGTSTTAFSDVFRPMCRFPHWGNNDYRPVVPYACIAGALYIFENKSQISPEFARLSIAVWRGALMCLQLVVMASRVAMSTSSKNFSGFGAEWPLKELRNSHCSATLTPCASQPAKHFASLFRLLLRDRQIRWRRS